MLIVKKFGGSSVRDKERIYNVARRCIEDYKAGNDLVVVLSAMGDTTDDIIAMAKSISDDPPKREMDMLLATGEQQSVALMAMAMKELGVAAISLNAFQVPMKSTSVYGHARLKSIETDRIKNELEQRKIVLVTGFQGIDRHDNLTTLGRGGSDTTAVALAAALHADKCEIYTDVEGIYTADPRIVPGAKKMDSITYEEMLEMATLGAQVMHNRSIELGKKYGVEIVVRSSLSTAEGTVIKEDAKVEGLMVNGVAADKNTARVVLLGVKNQPGMAFMIFDILAKAGIVVDLIIQSVGRDDYKDVAFTVSEDQMEETMKILRENNNRIKATDIEADKNVAKLSIIGAGIQTNPGVASQMFEALYNAGVNILMIGSSEIRITVIIAETDCDRAMNAVHKKFFEF